MPVLNPAITVITRNLAGQVVIQYSARVLRTRSNYVVLEARFNHADTPILDAETRRQVRAGLIELQQLFSDHKNPDLS
jgi:hypothetical protein